MRVTRKCSVFPAIFVTSTSLPTCISRKRQNTAGYPPGRSRCPSITALPRSPGCGPRLYQPTSSHGFCAGVAKSPFDCVPILSTGALIAIAGMIRRTGFAAGSVFPFGRTFDALLALIVCDMRASGTSEVEARMSHADNASTTIMASRQTLRRKVCIKRTTFPSFALSLSYQATCEDTTTNEYERHKSYEPCPRRERLYIINLWERIWIAPGIWHARKTLNLSGHQLNVRGAMDKPDSEDTCHGISLKRC